MSDFTSLKDQMEGDVFTPGAEYEDSTHLAVPDVSIDARFKWIQGAYSEEPAVLIVARTTQEAIAVNSTRSEPSRNRGEGVAR